MTAVRPRLAASSRYHAALGLAVVLALALGGCGTASPPATPTTPTGQPDAQVSTGPFARASVRPSATPDPGQAALAKFVALATSGGFSYQATFTGESRHTVNVLTIGKGLLQVNGTNVRVVATFADDQSGARIAVEHRSVGGKGWITYGPRAWQRLSRFGAASSMAAFAAVHGPSDVTYLGPVPADGGTVFKLSMASVIMNPIMIPFANLSDAAVTSSKLELLVDGAGRPVSGTASIYGRGRISGQLQEIVIDLDLAFVKVGQKVTIAAP